MLGSTCEDITVFRRCMLPMKCSSATFRFHYFPLDFAKRRLSYWFNIASGYPVAIQVLFIQSSLPLHANHTKVLCGDLSYIWSLDLVKEKLKCSNSWIDDYWRNITSEDWTVQLAQNSQRLYQNDNIYYELYGPQFSNLQRRLFIYICKVIMCVWAKK